MARISEASSCQTCKDRKIRCDLGKPVCRNCLRGSRDCRREVLKLSWPRPNTQRAVVGPAPGGGRSTRKLVRRGADIGDDEDYVFVNVSELEMATHLAILNPLENEHKAMAARSSRFFSRANRFHASPEPSRCIGSVFSALGSDDECGGSLFSYPDLFSYFYHEAADTLPTIDFRDLSYKTLLLRLGMADDSSSSRAVLCAVLALSCLYLHGNVEEAIRFKVLALQAMQETAEQGDVGVQQTLQHMAANLVLSQVEITIDKISYGFWGAHVCSAKMLLKHAFASNESIIRHAECQVLYRHMQLRATLGHFAVRHWRRPTDLVLHSNPQMDQSLRFEGYSHDRLRCEPHEDQIAAFEKHLPEELVLLDRVVNRTVMAPEDALYHDPQYSGFLLGLAARMGDVQARLRADVDATAGLDDGGLGEGAEAAAARQTALQRYIFLLATRIYFERAARRVSGPSTLITSLVKEAFVAMSSMTTSTISFPLFVVGCEATTEDQRRAVLDLVRRMRSEGGSGGVCEREAARMANVVELLKTSWTQDDLFDETEGYMDYVRRMHWVVTSREMLPAFV